MKKFLTCFFALVLTVGLSAQTKAWTVLVYVCADNNLAEDALDNLDQMMNVGSGPNLTLAVQVARGDDMGDAVVGGAQPWTGSKRFLVQKGSLKEVKNLGKVNSADPVTLRDFVSWGIKAYPAQHYALVFWDHGGGASGFGEDDSADGASFTLNDLRRGISGGLKDAGLTSLDLVGFDACLMANYETAKALAPLAKVMLASEELEPGSGWDYNSWSVAAENPKAGAEEVAQALMKGYAANCKSNGEGDNYTLSILRLDQVSRLEKGLQLLSSIPASEVKSVAGDLGRGRSRALEYGKTGDPEQDTHMVDLGNLALEWQKTPRLKPAADQLLAALKSIVAGETFGRGVKASQGLSIYFPPQKKLYEDFYDDVAVPEWKSLLTKYYDTGEALDGDEKAAFETDNAPAKDSVSLEDGQVTFAHAINSKSFKNVTEAVLYYGTIVNGKAFLLGDREADLVQESSSAVGTWDLSSLVMSQGKTKVSVYLSESQGDKDVVVYSVPFEYYADGRVKNGKNRRTVWLEVTLDLKTNEITSENFYEDDDNLTAALVPEKGSRIVTQIPVRNKDGDWDYLPQGPELDPSRPFDYEFKSLDPKKQFYLSLDITDFGGNTDSFEYEGEF